MMKGKERLLATGAALLSVLTAVTAIKVDIVDTVKEVARDDKVNFKCQYTTSVTNRNALNIIWNFIPDDPDKETIDVIQWFNALDEPVIGTKYKTRVKFTGDVMLNDCSITINNTITSDSGTYEVEVKLPTDLEGDRKDRVELVVLIAPSPPACSIAGGTEFGQDVILKCHSDEGSPKPTYSWNSYTIENLPRSLPANSVQQEDGLLLKNLTGTHSGFYICTSRNKIKFATCNVTLTVLAPAMKFPLYAGLVGGGVAVLIIIGIIVYCCCCRSKGPPEGYEMEEREEEDDESEHRPAKPRTRYEEEMQRRPAKPRNDGRNDDRNDDRNSRNDDRYNDRNDDRYGGRNDNRYNNRNEDRYGGRNDNRYDDRNDDRYGGRNDNRYDDRNDDRYGGTNDNRYNTNDNRYDRNDDRYGARNDDRQGGRNDDRQGGRNDDRQGGRNDYRDDRNDDRYAGRNDNQYDDRYNDQYNNYEGNQPQYDETPYDDDEFDDDDYSPRPSAEVALVPPNERNYPQNNYNA
ncbi:cell surface A33 antigen isoform X2 [Callorhinchus milii]|uniref:cell surface A33 antigen isoform X2 n=1 Tax=Callorhinchus milii TaxID=7868 RepID=UPI001C3FF5AE|nr:cell surface A33 antigen isoform X2 [Callorhinchus milii]